MMLWMSEKVFRLLLSRLHNLAWFCEIFCVKLRVFVVKWGI